MVQIKTNAVFVDIAQQEFCSFHAEANDLHSSSMTPFVTGCCLLFPPTFAPVSHREREEFTNSRARLVGHTDNDLVTPRHPGRLKPCNESEVENWIVNRFWNPFIIYQAKVVVRSSFRLWLFNATFWWHLGVRAACLGFIPVNLFQQVNDWIGERMYIGILISKDGAGVKSLQSGKENSYGARRFRGELHHLVHAIATDFTV